MFGTRRPWFSYFLAAVLVLGAAIPDAYAQTSGGAQTEAQGLRSSGSEAPPRDSTLLGVVWTPPDSPDTALQELDRIDALGATAVRLTRLPSAPVAARADSLRLRLYVDLPASYVAASRLQDTLSQAAPALDRLAARARQHNSITHVGLADAADTTVPMTCETLARWTERVHDQTPSLRTYYVTPFAATADRCADAVDRPLIDTRGHPAPVDRWRQWRSQTAVVGGIGAVGTWVRPSAPAGLQVPHSPERQARYLEEALSQVLNAGRSAPSVVFVARWQDRSSPRLFSRRFGLHAGEGTPRPAKKVVHGLYAGTQRVFAFPSGEKPATGPPVLLLLSWGLAALLGGLYARRLFVRQTVTRYFTAHGFYRDAVREGHDLHPGTNGILFGVVTVTVGIIAVRAARLAALQPSTERVLAAVPSGLRTVLAGGIEHPAAAGILAGVLVLGLLLIWMTALVVVARRWTRFSVAQGLMLLVWPCWPVLVALPVALVTASGALLSPSFFMLFLLFGGGVTLLYFTVRVLLDYRVVTGVPWPAVAMLGVPSPLVLGGGSLGVLTWLYGVPLQFLWHLITRT